MAILNYKAILFATVLLFVGCSSNLSKTQTISNSNVGFTIKVYKDADLYNTNEAQNFARLGMITLKKYFQKNKLKKIEVYFDDYYEKAKSVYFFHKNRLYKVEKIKEWDKNQKLITQCKKSGKSFIGCSQKEIADIKHDIGIYKNYNE